MHTSRSTIQALLAIMVCLSIPVNDAASGSSARRPESSPDSLTTSQEVLGSAIQVTLSAPQTTVSWDSRDSNRSEFALPLLYLHHGREATAQAERRLIVNLSGQVEGREIEIEAISLHVDVTTGEQHRVAAGFRLPHHPCSQEEPCTVTWAFDARTMLSDFYRLRVRDDTGGLLWANPHPDRPDFVILDTWDVCLGDYTGRVFYATLFPFARGQDDLHNRLAPEAVTDFVEQQFVPIIQETWHTQFHSWGFGPIYPSWDGDKVVEIFVTDPPFALFGGTGTYTISVYEDGSPYPERRLWWFSSSNSFGAYDSLENGVRVVFSHEFFHLVQWNVVLSTGCSTGRWANMFIEAQGKFAPSVQYPALVLSGEHIIRRNAGFHGAARRFLQLRLNTSYGVLEAEETYLYDAALYWRFLYEQFGDMAVIRAALEEMACRGGADPVTSMDDVMDAALARVDGPSRSFEESLTAFAQANYALRLENGRCSAVDLVGCGGRYYDPQNLYTDRPSLEAELYHSGFTSTYHGTVGSSYGMDFLEVRLAQSLDGEPLGITLQSEGAKFSVQLWALQDGEARPRAVTQHPELLEDARDRVYTYHIPGLDTTQYDRLALIITRLDSGERTDPAGGYLLTLDSPAPVEADAASTRAP